MVVSPVCTVRVACGRDGCSRCGFASFSAECFKNYVY